MLVLSRTRDEDVIITIPDGRRIVVKLVDIRGDKCRLGFTADSDIPIHRGEVQAAIDEENTREVELKGGLS